MSVSAGTCLGERGLCCVPPWHPGEADPLPLAWHGGVSPALPLPEAGGSQPPRAGTEDYQLNSECNSDVVCPPKCRCDAGVVECSNLKLTKIPDRIPQSTAEL